MTKIFETPENLAQQFAEDFYKLVEKVYTDGRIIHVALSGGSTPKIWFEVLRKNYATLIAWENIHFYWGDERMVPSKDKESNYGEAKRILFDHISIPPANIHPILGENDTTQELERYSSILDLNLSQQKNLPVFDLMILGMGDDGHTASIFPDQMEILNSKNLVELAYHPVSRQKRISLTGSVINNSRQIIFLITGSEKAPVLAKILNKTGNYKDYPTAHIRPVSGKVEYYLDKEAAVGLK